MSNDYTVLRNQPALLVLRVWMERGSARPLRAYIRHTADTSVGFEETLLATDVEAAVDSVRMWLHGLLDTEQAEIAAGLRPERRVPPLDSLDDGHGSRNGATGDDSVTAV